MQARLPPLSQREYSVAGLETALHFHACNSLDRDAIASPQPDLQTSLLFLARDLAQACFVLVH